MSETETLDRETVLAAVRECVTVVKPGEVLVIRVPLRVPISAIQRYQEQADAVCERLGIKILVVAAEELGVAQVDTDEAFARRVEKVNLQWQRRNRFPMGRV